MEFECYYHFDPRLFDLTLFLFDLSFLFLRNIEIFGPYWLAIFLGCFGPFPCKSPKVPCVFKKSHNEEPLLIMYSQ